MILWSFPGILPAMTDKECMGYASVEETATGFYIRTGCGFPEDQCDLKIRDLCPREANPTFAQMSQETGGRLTEERIRKHAQALLPQFKVGATSAVRIKCGGRHRPM